MNGDLADHLIQVVGHTASECYRAYRGAEEHPPVDSKGCHRGLVRRTRDLKALCVDGGMYLGARAFLQISPDGKFTSFEKDVHDLDNDGIIAEYWTRKLTEEVCPASRVARIEVEAEVLVDAEAAVSAGA